MQCVHVKLETSLARWISIISCKELKITIVIQALLLLDIYSVEKLVSSFHLYLGPGQCLIVTGLDAYIQWVSTTCTKSKIPTIMWV